MIATPKAIEVVLRKKMIRSILDLIVFAIPGKRENSDTCYQVSTLVRELLT